MVLKKILWDFGVVCLNAPVVAPMLLNHKSWPFAVNLTPTSNNGLDKDRHLNLKQLRAVDISRIGKKQGRLENQYLQPIKQALTIVFDL